MGSNSHPVLQPVPKSAFLKAGFFVLSIIEGVVSEKDPGYEVSAKT